MMLFAGAHRCDGAEMTQTYSTGRNDVSTNNRTGLLCVQWPHRQSCDCGKLTTLDGRPEFWQSRSRSSDPRQSYRREGDTVAAGGSASGVNREHANPTALLLSGQIGPARARGGDNQPGSFPIISVLPGTGIARHRTEAKARRSGQGGADTPTQVRALVADVFRLGNHPGAGSLQELEPDRVQPPNFTVRGGVWDGSTRLTPPLRN